MERRGHDWLTECMDCRKHWAWGAWALKHMAIPQKSFGMLDNAYSAPGNINGTNALDNWTVLQKTHKTRWAPVDQNAITAKPMEFSHYIRLEDKHGQMVPRINRLKYISFMCFMNITESSHISQHGQQPMYTQKARSRTTRWTHLSYIKNPAINCFGKKKKVTSSAEGQPWLHGPTMHHRIDKPFFDRAETFKIVCIW